MTENEIYQEIKLKLVPEKADNSCEGCILLTPEMDCECLCKGGYIFVMEGDDER